MPSWEDTVHKVPDVQTLVTVRAFSKTFSRTSFFPFTAGTSTWLLSLAASAVAASPLTGADAREAARRMCECGAEERKRESVRLIPDICFQFHHFFRLSRLTMHWLTRGEALCLQQIEAKNCSRSSDAVEGSSHLDVDV